MMVDDVPYPPYNGSSPGQQPRLVCLWKVILLIVVFCFSWSQVIATELDQLMKMENSSFQIVGAYGEVLLEKDADMALIPASTIKLLTAYMALETWGQNYRFTTEFYLDDTNNLWVKGLGDPLLISEELDLIITQLKSRGIRKINNLVLDTSYFDKNIRVDGQSDSNNPYDAPLGALVTNFNTINVMVDKAGVASAEPQTPITPLARKLGKALGPGKQRINLGSAELGPQYFSEVFSKKLRQQGISIRGGVRFSTTPPTLAVFYQHKNSQTLAAVVRAMLKYSNNFMANQLYLMLGIEYDSAPATMDKSTKAMTHFIGNNFNWEKYKIVEGAGLSRKNQLSAKQLTDLLVAMQAYANLLPEKQAGIIAKTGTLTGIKTYAGYFAQDNKLIPFSLLINQPVTWEFRNKVARQLRKSTMK